MNFLKKILWQKISSFCEKNSETVTNALFFENKKIFSNLPQVRLHSHQGLVGISLPHLMLS
jgi:hypothetical protein